jgi:hypothetical protein
MFLSEIHPNIRKELHKREFILERTPASGSAARIIRQEESLNSTKENRDLLAESFARSHWIRVFSPVDTRKLVSNAWKQKLQRERMKKPEFGVSNRYFEHTGDKELIQEWLDFIDDAGGGTPMMIDNPLGGYNTVLLQSGLMYRDKFEKKETLNDTTWENQNKMYTGFMGVYGRNQKPGDLMAPITDKNSIQGPTTPHGGMPIPGIKSISVDYVGEMKASKEATIEWVCWSFRDLERLTPHFLEMGKLVVLEWGWGGLGGSDKPIPIDYDKILEATEGRTTKVSLHDEIQETIFQNGGNYDAMVGVISNFEWSLRDDGGFDCTTKLKSRGVNIINQALGSPTNTTGMGKKDEEEGTYSQVTFDKFMEQIDTFINDIGKTMVISSDALKTYISNNYEKAGVKTGQRQGSTRSGLHGDVTIENFLKWQFNNNRVAGSGDKFKKGNISDGIFQPVGWDAWINKDDKVGPWMSWGWIEDNILTRFLGKVDSNNKLVQEFRSVDLIYKGKKELGYEPTKISNHSGLITVDPDICIIPGQYPLHLSKWQGQYIQDNPMGYTAALTDGMFGSIFNIPPFIAYKWKKVKGEYKHPSLNANPGEYHKHLLDEKYTAIKEAGYMRHLLIHLDIFKECFEGVDSVEAACQSLFNKLNSTTGIWDLHLTTDGERVKVVDRNYTEEKVKDLLTEPSEWGYGAAGFKDKDALPTGKVYIFPSWGRSSMVNSQTLSAKLPESAAVTAMYGGVASPGANPPEGGGDPADFLASSALQSTIDPTQKNITGAWEKKNGKLGKFGTQFPYNLRVDKDKGKWEKFGVGNGFLFDVSLVAGAKSTSKGKQTSVDLPIDSNTFVREALVTNLQLVTNNLIGDKSNLIYDKKISDNLFINIDQYNSRLVNYNQGWTDADDQAYNPYIAESQRIVPEKTGAGGEKEKQILKENMIVTMYNPKTGKLKNTFPHAYVDAMKYLIGVNRATSIFGIGGSSPMLKMELELEIQGIGGIVPGNAFNVSMLPSNYKGKVIFQVVDINQELSDTGWKTTLTGQMRVNISEQSPEEIASFLTRRAAGAHQEYEDIMIKKLEKIYPARDEVRKLWNPGQEVAKAAGT